MDANERDNSPAETETWVKEQVSGIWRVYYSPIIREDNEVCRCLTEYDADAIIDARAKAGRVRELQAALLEASYGPNFGDSHCWCHEDYCIQIPSPRDHSARCLRIRAALLAPTPREDTKKTYFCGGHCIYPCATAEECENLHEQAATEGSSGE